MTVGDIADREKYVREPACIWLSAEKLKNTAVEPCQWRAHVTELPDKGLGAVCTRVVEWLGHSHGVALDLCKVCQANGKADIEGNAFLRHLVSHVAIVLTTPGERATKPVRPSDEQIEKSLETIRRLRGDDIAKDFIDLLVYEESITPDKAVELYDSLEREP